MAKTFTFSKELYPKISVLKAAFAYTDRAYIHLDATPTDYIVEIRSKQDAVDINLDEFTNEVLSQCVRHEIYQRTKNIRELLVARSLSTSLIELPPAQKIADDFDANPDEILVNWFEQNEKNSIE